MAIVYYFTNTVLVQFVSFFTPDLRCIVRSVHLNIKLKECGDGLPSVE